MSKYISMMSLVKQARKQIRLLLADPKARRHAKVGDVRHWKMKREFQISFLKQVGLIPDHFLLDIGCGTLRGGLPIIAYLKEGHYFGIDTRQEVLDEGIKEIRDENFDYKNPVLIFAEDLSQVDFPRKFDFIWAFSVLIHMTDDILEDCLAFVSDHLEANGHFFANVIFGDQTDGCWEGFPVMQKNFDFYQEASSRNSLSVVDMGPLRSFGHVSGVSKQDEQRMLKFWKI